MIVLFWDIDGTLLTTGKGGVPAWEQAVREVTGRDFELASIRIPGLTDYQIAVRTFELLGVEPNGHAAPHGGALREPAARISAARQGQVMPNVREILDATRDRRDIRSYLLTGNTRGGAKAKLTHYELFDYFADGAFAEDPGERATIAVRALELARQAGPIADESIFVIGDTPHDIECANAIGAKTIAVATGGYSFEELQSHHPWRVMRELPPVDGFLELIGAGPADAGPYGPPEGGRHVTNRDEARHQAVPGALARVATGAAVVLRALRRVPDWRGVLSPIGNSGKPHARRPGWAAGADGDGDRFLRARDHARERPGGGTDVPRRRSARAAVRRLDDGVRRMRSLPVHGPGAVRRARTGP